MAADRLCAQCGCPLPPGLPRGPCPTCLLRAGLQSKSASSAGPLQASGTWDHQRNSGFELGAGKVLETLAQSIGSISRVLLPDTDTDDSRVAVIKPTSSEMPAPAERGDRFQLFGEIARGGMGAILKGRDADLGRDLAVKVLLEQHRDNTDLVRRFVEEAQIGGQLQHPGIVPVYELGTFHDRRPYFAMKLVKGRTLAALLSGRKDPRDDLPRFLGIFEQVAQTVAYAHARGVIHRDLKPSNVMVGSFGEVQVMDWGLAKVLKEGGVADEERGQSPPAEVSVIRTVRSGSADDESQVGSVLGTPAYMAPEQAGGDIERVDRRADVFGLGSILCEVLTGQPAYTGRDNNEVFRQAVRGDTADASARLGACGADADLVALARDCLASEPTDRPRDAGVVAGRVTAYLTGVQEKLRNAERERAVAEARAVEEGRRRKLQVGLAAAVLALTTVGGLSTTYYLQQRQARVATVARILGEAITLREQARDHADDPARWHAALVAIRRVEDVLGTGGGAETQGQLDALRAEVEAGSGRAERDRRLLDRLVDIRSAKADDADGSATDAAYADAFAEGGLDLAALPPARAGEQIKARPPATKQALAVALDDWAAVRRRRRRDRAGAQRLSDVARAADPDPWRRDLRVALDQADTSARLTALQALARSARFDALGAVSLDLLGTALDTSGDSAAAESVLRAAQRRHPGDVWINYDLAGVCEKRNRRDHALRFYTAARSIRPETAHELAHLLTQKGESDEAIAVFQDLVRLRPRNGRHLTCLGNFLAELGRPEQAAPFLEAAVAADREAIREKPDDSSAHNILGLALRAQGKLDLAIAEYREAIRIKPNDALFHNNLGLALRAQGKSDEAIAEIRTAIRLNPDSALAHHYLGNILSAKGNLDEAIAEYRTAIRLKPDDAMNHNNLGVALRTQGKNDEAMAEYRTAIRLKPDDALYHSNLAGTLCDVNHDYDGAIAEAQAAIRLNANFTSAHHALGTAFFAQGKLEMAAAEYRVVTRVKPDDAEAHANLGNVLKVQGKPDEAIAEYRAAIRLKPDYAEPHCNLGLLLTGKNGQDTEGLALLRRGHELGSKQANWRYPSGEWVRLAERGAELRAGGPKPGDAMTHYSRGVALRAQGKLDLAIAEYRAAIGLNPDSAEVHNALGNALRSQGKPDEAIVEYRAAIRLNPNVLTNLRSTLKTQGKLGEAIAEYRAAIRLNPDDAQAHTNIGNALKVEGKLAEAITEFREAIRLKPDDAYVHSDFGAALKAQGRFDEAIAEFREAIRLKRDFVLPHTYLGNALGAQGKLDEAIAEYRVAIGLNPAADIAHNDLGNALRTQGKLDEAIAEYRTLIRLRPEDANAHNSLGIALRDQGKLDEAIAAYRESIRLAPNGASVHSSLGNALRAQGKLEDALVAFRRAGALAKPGSVLARDIPGRIQQVEQMIALAGRLPAVLKGEDTPRDAAEFVAFGRLCHDQGLHAASVRLYAAALAADPKLGDDRQTRHHRYDAACYAALAGCGKSNDDPPPDQSARAALRQQALDWLRAERAAWALYLETGPLQARARVVQTLKHWQRDADLAGAREGEAVSRLPEEEQRAWRGFWSDVETLLKKAEGDGP